MEKRLFLAIFLSIAVVFVFQSVFVPKPTNGNAPFLQTTDNKGFADEKSVLKPHLETSQQSTTASFTEDLTTLKSKGIEIELTNKGGNIRSIFLADDKYHVPARNYLNIPTFENSKFDLESATSVEVVYTLITSDWKVVKTYQIESGRTIRCRLELYNNSNGKLTLFDNLQAFVIDLSRMDKNPGRPDWTLYEYVIKTDSKFIRKSSLQNLNDRWNKEEEKSVKWFGFRDHYFATIAEPNFAVGKYSIKAISAKELSLGTTISNINVAPGERLSYGLKVYVGPQNPEILKASGAGYEKIMAFSDWGWLDAISKVIYWLLGFIHTIVPSWGLSIIFISLTVYGLMYPLTIKSLTSMRKMQVLQPKIKELQDKHSKNPEKMNQEVMQLYRQHGVNPLGGCLPMLLQMPIFVGLYQVLWRSVYFRGEGFLWIKDLSMPDRLFKLPFNAPFIGEYFNIFPVLMVIIMAVQQRLSMKSMVTTDPDQAMQQKMMATFLPILMGVIFYNFSSGLNLYFVVFYLLSAFTQWKIAQKNAVA